MTSLQAVAVPGIPTLTSGDDVAAVISPHLAGLTWPDGSTGLRGEDIVVIAGKIVAKVQGRWHRAGEEPDGFRTRAGIPDQLGLKAPVDLKREAGLIRRGLAARFGGRPGVIIAGSARTSEPGRGVLDVALAAAGIDAKREGGESVIDAVAAAAGVLTRPGCPVVVVRGVTDVLTWED
ncbi:MULTISPECIES: hypothetical protein [Trueperella]|uniref:Coenzyme F420-0:L-glutamate ligase/coenzyme F420-1:gamma-L-glutamate ligase n=1 Tax=Trueperella abortisuis TaxID=445930 RepID=A0ABT9PI81_9ACTO|nr:MULTISPECIES: hypothetical protein [Trueperella]MDP9832094.1 coenzyme F420-0:L-glutamate ligase/coenzyme F420-1:gamma-L-glutamate ligase [Trueperella abortisuis]